MDKLDLAAIRAAYKRAKETGRLDMVAFQYMLPLLNALDEANVEVERLREALEIAKRGYVDCAAAERQTDGACLGYGKSETDDEPCEQCKACPRNSAPPEGGE